MLNLLALAAETRGERNRRMSADPNPPHPAWR